jgi:hypothetical protein
MRDTPHLDTVAAPDRPAWSDTYVETKSAELVARSCSRVRIPSFAWVRDNSMPPATSPSTTMSASTTRPRRTRGVCARARIVCLALKAGILFCRHFEPPP